MRNAFLVPLDGSATSEAALSHAEALARRSSGIIILVRAVHTRWALEAAESYLGTFAEQLSNRGLAVETGVPYGSAATWIVEEIALRKADLVIMATHDRSGADRWLHGSVAETVVSRAGVPVLLVRAATGRRPAERFEQIAPVLLVPLDGSELAEAALAPAAALAATLDGSLVLVSVVPRPGQIVFAEGIGVPRSQEDSERQQHEAETYLRMLCSGFVSATVVRLGDPAAEIALEAEKRGAAAVVMATHGRTGVVRTLLGSVAGQVVHAANSPVMLVRPNILRASAIPLFDLGSAVTP